MKSFILANRNEFSGRWKPLSLAQSFLLLVESVPEISGSRFLKKYHILTEFLANGNHFRRYSQTAVNYHQWKKFFLQLAQIFQSIHHSGWRKRAFCLLETVLFSFLFFLSLVETIIESRMEKTNHICGHQIFSGTF